jgi:hypothetical protein
MKAQIKRRVAGRTLTLISKIEELQSLGIEHGDLGGMLPCGLEGWMQELVNLYTQMTEGLE